jgi:hypothetical protein
MNALKKVVTSLYTQKMRRDNTKIGNKMRKEFKREKGNERQVSKKNEEVNGKILDDSA